MAFYIKVTKQVADKLGVTDIRNKTADGNVLLWQADLTAIPGTTIFERASYVGGVCLQPTQAKGETVGTDYPAEVYTPDRYKDETSYVPPTVTGQPDNGEDDGTEDAEIIPDETVPVEETPVEETQNPAGETEEGGGV